MTNINTSVKESSGITSRSVNKTENGTPIIEPGKETDKDLFLKLLVAQMKNQDPFNAQDPTQYVTQLAQFNMLEQTMALNENIEYMLGMTNGILVNSAMGTASNLIGKEIEAYAPTSEGTDTSEDKPKTVSGKVESVHIKDGVVYMSLRDKESGEDANLKWYDYNVEINYKNIFRTVISPSIFIKIKSRDDVFFDENLGVGRKFGSGEETDMILELLHRGYKGMFLNDYIVYHPNKIEPIEKIYSYGLGYGATIKKQVKLRDGSGFVLNYLVKDSLLKPIVGMIINFVIFNKYKADSYRKRMISRIKGYLEYEI